VYEAKNWNHGVLVGAGVASETTAAAAGEIGIVRRDPMAMKPFCGYNFADYWAHWLSFADRSEKLPKVFHVNWFRQDASGNFMWPGFGENLRVLRWIIDRCENRVEARETAVGYLPKAEDIDTRGLEVSAATMDALLSIDTDQWKDEMASVGEYLKSYGDRLPAELLAAQADVVRALETSD
jgi:phosphoenolpyruvate carboxykinase (GTP)